MESHTPNPEILIENAARVCYDSFDKKSEGSASRIIEHLIRSGHESVLEHCSATFFVVGVSRALTHQLVRHRIASYSQRSQRYVKETEPNYVTPPSILENKENVGVSSQDQMARAKFENAMLFAWNTYNELLKMGIKGEDARFVLPNACCSSLYMTMNFRELRHFLKLRTSKHAQWEIRNMAKEIHSQLMEIAPNVFADIKFEV
jgi:thymidylate synthase (FAD)